MNGNVIILSIILCVLTFPGAAPADDKATVITYYNMTRGDEEKLRFMDGKWIFIVPDQSVKITVLDIENGYFEYRTGIGVKVTVALFMAKNREPMLAEFHEYYGTDGCPDAEYIIRTYKLREGRMAEVRNILPVIHLELFFKNGYDPKKIAPYVAPDRDWNKYIRYRLPQMGTTVEAFLYAGDLECAISRSGESMAAKERGTRREFLNNLRKEPVKLKWNMETGTFDPPGQG